MLSRVIKQGSALITSALVLTVLPFYPKAEAEIPKPQVQAKSTRPVNLRSQNKHSQKHLLPSIKLMELGIPQRRVSAGSR